MEEVKADVAEVKADVSDMKALLEKLVAQSLQNTAYVAIMFVRVFEL
jgi:hypothetical protein